MGSTVPQKKRSQFHSHPVYTRSPWSTSSINCQLQTFRYASKGLAFQSIRSPWMNFAPHPLKAFPALNWGLSHTAMAPLLSRLPVKQARCRSAKYSYSWIDGNWRPAPPTNFYFEVHCRVEIHPYGPAQPSKMDKPSIPRRKPFSTRGLRLMDHGPFAMLGISSHPPVSGRRQSISSSSLETACIPLPNGSTVILWPNAECNITTALTANR